MESLLHAMLSNALAATALAVVVAALSRTCRRPAVIHGLWLVVMIKLVTPPVVPVSLPVAVGVGPAGTHAAEVGSNRHKGPAPPAATRPDRQADAAGAPSIAELPFHPGPAEPGSTVPDWETSFGGTRFVDTPPGDLSVAFVLLAGWKWEHVVLSLVLSGALAGWALATVRIVRFQRVLRDVQPVPGEWQARTDDLAKRLGLGRRPAVCLVPGRVPPMLWAIGGRPRLLVPSQLWSTMSADDRTSLLLHELAHLRRRDHWVRWLELIVVGLYWWFPAVWWIRRSLREAEEQCCDAWVVWAMPSGAKTYAAALLAAVEFVSGARTAPVAASATSGNGHVSCLKRRLRMILRAKTPKGLSWAGRLAVMATAALLLPLAPSWAQKDDPGTPPAGLDRLSTTDDSKINVDAALAQNRDQQAPQARRTDGLEAFFDELDAFFQKGSDSDEPLEARIREEFHKDPAVIALIGELAATKEQLDRARAVARLPNDPGRRAAEKRHKQLTDQYVELWKSKHDELRAQLSKDDDKDDDAKKDKDNDTAQRLEEQIKDLIGKLGKELEPVGEEIRKALEQAVREVHQSLEKEGVSVEELRRALEKSYAELRGAVEKGGPVNEEMRKAMERSRQEMREATERAREEMREAMEGSRKTMREAMRKRLEAARERQRELMQKDQPDREKKHAQTDRERAKDAHSDRERPRDEPEKGASKDGEGQPNREQLDTVRKEVRDLEQQLRRATRQLEQLERRESLRNMTPRRPGGPRAGTTPPPGPTDQPATARSPQPPSPPTAPLTPARPERPNIRRPFPPRGPGANGGGGPPRGGRITPRSDYEQRFRDLDDKLNQLLKELEKLKDDKKPDAIRKPAESAGRLASPGMATAFSTGSASSATQLCRL